MTRIALQIYSLREAGDLDTQLALAKACGFDWVETVATHGLGASAFAERVAAHGLRVSSMHVSLQLLESERGMLIDACRRTGCPLLVMPWLPMGRRPATAAGWQALGRGLGEIGAELQREGLHLAYHNHEFELLLYGGRSALEHVLGAAAPEHLGWEADLGWVSRAGADPALWLDRLGHRLLAVHAKDIAPDGSAVDEDGWTALGEGVVPWPALLERLRPMVDLIVFEHDHPVDFKRTLTTSRACLARHLG